MNKWWLSLLSLPLGGMLTFIVWAADTRYLTEPALEKYVEVIIEPKFVTVGQLKDFAEEQNRLELEQRVEELQLKDRLNMTTEYEKALLEQLERKLEQ